MIGTRTRAVRGRARQLLLLRAWHRNPFRNSSETTRHVNRAKRARARAARSRKSLSRRSRVNAKNQIPVRARPMKRSAVCSGRRLIRSGAATGPWQEHGAAEHGALACAATFWLAAAFWAQQAHRRYGWLDVRCGDSPLAVPRRASPWRSGAPLLGAAAPRRARAERARNLARPRLLLRSRVLPLQIDPLSLGVSVGQVQPQAHRPARR
jgi:hypothetical protein